MMLRNDADPRAELRRMQACAKTARSAAQRAEEAAERGRVALTRAQDALSAYAGLDEAVARCRVDSLKTGVNSTELPRHLVDNRRRQQTAQLELADAERATLILEREAVEARATLAQVEADLLLAIDCVMQSEAMSLAVRMREREAAAATDRLLLGSFLAGRPLNAPQVPWTLQSIPMEPIHGHLLDIAAAARIPSAGPVWQELRAKLLVDAGAVLGHGP